MKGVGRYLGILKEKEITYRANGVTAATIFSSNTQNAALGIFFGLGADAERRLGVPAGTAHMLEHSLISHISTDKRRRFLVNGVTTRNFMGIFGQAEKKDQKELVDTLLGTISTEIAEENIAAEKENIIKEHKTVQDTLSMHIENAYNFLYKNQNLSPILGAEEQRYKIDKTHLQKMLFHMAEKNNVFIVGVGNIDHKNICSWSKNIIFPNKHNISTETLSKNTEEDNVELSKMLCLRKEDKITYIPSDTDLNFSSIIKIENKSAAAEDKYVSTKSEIPRKELYILIAYKIPGVYTNDFLLFSTLKRFLNWYFRKYENTADASTNAFHLAFDQEGGLIFHLNNTNPEKGSISYIKGAVKKYFDEFASVQKTQEPVLYENIQQLFSELQHFAYLVAKNPSAACIKDIDVYSINRKTKQNLLNILDSLDKPIYYEYKSK